MSNGTAAPAPDGRADPRTNSSADQQSRAFASSRSFIGKNCLWVGWPSIPCVAKMSCADRLLKHRRIASQWNNRRNIRSFISFSISLRCDAGVFQLPIGQGHFCASAGNMREIYVKNMKKTTPHAVLFSMFTRCRTQGQWLEKTVKQKDIERGREVGKQERRERVRE